MSAQQVERIIHKAQDVVLERTKQFDVQVDSHIAWLHEDVVGVAQQCNSN
jgi:hypothetical protein